MKLRAEHAVVLLAAACLSAGCCKQLARRTANPADRIQSDVYVHLGKMPKCAIELPPYNRDVSVCPGSKIHISTYSGYSDNPLKPFEGQVVAFELVEFAGGVAERARFTPFAVVADDSGRGESVLALPPDVAGAFRVKAVFPDGGTQSVTYSRVIRATRQHCD